MESPNTGSVPESLGPAKCAEQGLLGAVPVLGRVYLSCKRRAWIPGLGGQLDILELTEKLGLVCYSLEHFLYPEMGQGQESKTSPRSSG